MDAAHSARTPPPLLPASAALFLDFDGTLAHIAMAPDRVAVAQHLPPLLAALRLRQGEAVALLTGRRLEDIDALLAPNLLAAAGLHGAELRLDPDLPATCLEAPTIAPLVAALRARFGEDPRVLVEDKHAACALHYRMAPERAGDCLAAMRELAPSHGLEVMAGKMVVEARPAGVSKGVALRRLAGHGPFAGRMPVFAGDDTTDEEGFAVAASLGGYGIKVGGGASHARHGFDNVDQVHDWLRASLDAGDQRTES